MSSAVSTSLPHRSSTASQDTSRAHTSIAEGSPLTHRLMCWKSRRGGLPCSAARQWAYSRGWVRSASWSGVFDHRQVASLVVFQSQTNSPSSSILQKSTLPLTSRGPHIWSVSHVSTCHPTMPLPSTTGEGRNSRPGSSMRHHLLVSGSAGGRPLRRYSSAMSWTAMPMASDSDLGVSIFSM